MSTFASYGYPVVYTKTTGDAAMPSTITGYVTQIPLHNGKYRRDIYFPEVASLTTTATTQTYTPAANSIMSSPGAAGHILVCSRGLTAATNTPCQIGSNGVISIVTGATTGVLGPFLLTAFFNA